MAWWKVCPPEQLMTETYRHAAVLASRPLSSLLAVKRTMTDPVRPEIDAPAHGRTPASRN